MNNFIARVLVEHTILPEQEDYSSFSEMIILGKFSLPDNCSFSQLMFDEQQDILNLLTSKIAQNYDDSYTNADGNTFQQSVREIAKIEDLDASITISQDTFLEIDERLYTFGEKISFQEFKQRYNFGQFSG